MRLFQCILCLLVPLAGHALEVNGTSYVRLTDVAGKLGMRSSWLEKGERLRLDSSWTRMDFEVHKREMLLNGLRVHLGYPVVESKGRLYLSESDLTHQIRPILTPQLNGPPPKLRHIILDPGHGGKDPGAENLPVGLREKALALDLAMRLQKRLQAEGFRVTLTRTEDRFIPLRERALLANRLEGDLFISLHFNASGKSGVEGVETFVYTPVMQPSTSRADLHASDRKSYPGNRDGAWSTLLAYYVQRSLEEELGAADRGLKRARFTVLEELSMPGILVEGGFVTHPAEGRNIGSRGYRDRIAAALVEAVQVYQRTLQRLAREAS
ncbi:MAG: N-acetylmuramoyl-L-alanine amidase [Puniceicoccaceae bacterium]